MEPNRSKWARTWSFETQCVVCSCSYTAKAARSKYCEACAKSTHDKYKQEYLNVSYRIRKLLNGSRGRAKAKNLPFDLDFEFLSELWGQQEGICPISGRPFDLKAWGLKGQVNPNGPSIDRIKPELGYVKTNVRFVIYNINVALSDFGLEHFLLLCKDVLETNRI